MIKLIHIVFAFLTIGAFVGKFLLSEARSELLQEKAFKIAPHIISSLLLLSGIILASQGYGLAAGHGWLVAKLIAVVGFIGLGILTMRFEGQKRWLAFAGAIACFLYVGMVAVTKNALLFL